MNPEVKNSKWKLSKRASSNPNLVNLELKASRVKSGDQETGDSITEERVDSQIHVSSENQGTPVLFTSERVRNSVVGPHSIKKEANVEVYGFVGWVASFFGLGLYLTWAYLPNNFLHELGVSYYPDKWWAIAFPAHLSVSVIVLMWVGYMSINLLNNPPLNSLEYFTSDEEGTESNTTNVANGGIAPICDLPLTRVNQILYNQNRRKHKKSRSSQLFSPRHSEK